MDFQGKVALLVGASSGMGRVLALRLAAEGAIVVATARRRERLDMLAADVHARGGRCSAHAADAQDGRAAASVVQACIANMAASTCSCLTPAEHRRSTCGECRPATCWPTCGPTTTSR
jgi:NAD(P)-dependent dehydrogenase (short-subunit alcohol dehydrogenase family)